MTLLISTLFMPYYLASRCATCITSVNDFDIVRTYIAPELGLMVVYNGFGSLFCMFCILLGLILTIVHFVEPRPLTVPITITILFLLALLLLDFGNGSFGRPIGDRMLIGYYVSITVIIAFLFNALYRVYKLNQTPDERDNSGLSKK